MLNENKIERMYNPDAGLSDADYASLLNGELPVILATDEKREKAWIKKWEYEDYFEWVVSDEEREKLWEEFGKLMIVAKAF